MREILPEKNPSSESPAEIATEFVIKNNNKKKQSFPMKSLSQALEIRLVVGRIYWSVFDNYLCFSKK